MYDVSTNELQYGDIVVTHGLRCLIDRDIESWVAGGRRVYGTAALVLNRDDVPDAVVPVSWTKNRGEADGEHRWYIQGNDLARWYVERELFDTPSKRLAEAERFSGC